MLKQIKISAFSAVALLQGFDKTWGARNVLCRRHNLHIEWNWKKSNFLGRGWGLTVRCGLLVVTLVVWGLSLAGGVGVVLGLVGWGLSLVVLCAGRCLGRGGVLTPEGPAPPRCGRGGLFLLVLFILALAVGLLSQKRKKKKKKKKPVHGSNVRINKLYLRNRTWLIPSLTQHTCLA